MLQNIYALVIILDKQVFISALCLYATTRLRLHPLQVLNEVSPIAQYAFHLFFLFFFATICSTLDFEHGGISLTQFLRESLKKVVVYQGKSNFCKMS
jgi:hypothetical protein